MADFYPGIPINMRGQAFKTDAIAESSVDAGLSIDGVALKDGGGTFSALLNANGGLGNAGLSLSFASGAGGAATFYGGVTVGGTLSTGGYSITIGGNKITGLGAGTTSGDSVRYEQVIGVFLPLAGGTMTGNILIGAYGIGNSAAVLTFASGTTGKATFTGAVDMGALDVTGNITVSGTVDGVDVGAIPTTYLPLAGGTMAGAIAMGGSDVTGAGSFKFNATEYLTASGSAVNIYSAAYVGIYAGGSLVAYWQSNGLNMGDDTYLGLGASSGRLVFDTTGTDSITVANATLVTGLVTVGGTVTMSGNQISGCGNITMDGASTVDGVDVSAIPTTYLPLAGGTMTGGLNMGGKAVDNVDYLDVGTVIERDRAYFNAYRTEAFDMPASNTWYDLPWNVAATVNVNCLHIFSGATPEKIILSKAGTYLITWSIHTTGYSVTSRLLDDGTEIPGSSRSSWEDVNQRVQITGLVLAAIAAGSVIELQVGTNVAGIDIAYFDDATLPDPTTFVSASISIVRIGP